MLGIFLLSQASMSICQLPSKPASARINGRIREPDNKQHNKALHPTAYSSVRSSLRFRRRVRLGVVSAHALYRLHSTISTEIEKQQELWDMKSVEQPKIVAVGIRRAARTQSVDCGRETPIPALESVAVRRERGVKTDLFWGGASTGMLKRREKTLSEVRLDSFGVFR